jgi:hypothetical protein
LPLTALDLVESVEVQAPDEFETAFRWDDEGTPRRAHRGVCSDEALSAILREVPITRQPD